MSLSGDTLGDMKAKWGFIETPLISSSNAPSAWMRAVVAGRSQNDYCVSMNTASDHGRTDYPQIYKPSTILRPAGAAQLIDVNIAALGYGDRATVADIAITDSIMLQRLRF